MKVLDFNKRRQFWVRALLLATAVVAVFLFLAAKRDLVIKEAGRMIEGWISRELGVEIHVARVSGNFWGVVKLEGVEAKGVFTAKSITAHYRFVDFISKNIGSGIDLEMQDPVFYWRPHIRVKKKTFPFLAWMDKVHFPEMQHFALRVRNMTLWLGSGQRKFSGIDLEMRNDRIFATVPIAKVIVHINQNPELLK